MMPKICNMTPFHIALIDGNKSLITDYGTWIWVPTNTQYVKIPRKTLITNSNGATAGGTENTRLNSKLFIYSHPQGLILIRNLSDQFR